MLGAQPPQVLRYCASSSILRKFFVIAKVSKAPIAVEAVRRLDELFALERTINGKSPD